MNVLFVHNNFPAQYRFIARALSRDPKVKVAAIGTTGARHINGVDLRKYTLNDADVSAPRWKREWLDPTAEFCSVHHRPLETVPASVFRLSNHFDAALRAISRYREKCLFRATGRLR